MLKSPTEHIHEGAAILDPILCKYGFEFRWGGSGHSSGGPFAFGAFVNGDRKLELHYRHSLGLVRYHFGKFSLDHDLYMRAVLGRAGGNRYPGYSDEAQAQFEDLKFDLEHFATAFLLGKTNGAKEWQSKQGFSRLP